MEMRAHYILIGSFVMFAVAMAFLFVLRVTSTQGNFDTYEVIFEERVTGLSNGSIVRYNGIQVGEVESLILDPEDPSNVIARVRVNETTPVTTDTTVELEPVGFTGLAIIQFVGGSKDAPLLKDVSEERVPRIVADTSGISQFIAGTSETIARANRILSDNNIDNITKTLNDIQLVTGAVADNRDEIAALIQNANTATEELTQTLENLWRASDGVEALLSEDGPQVIDNADALITDIRTLVGETEALLSENRESFRYFTDQGLGQVAPALAEARQLMRSLDYMLREIERDPKAFFLGEATPEYNAENSQ